MAEGGGERGRGMEGEWKEKGAGLRLGQGE